MNPAEIGTYTAGLRDLADWLDAHPEWVPLGACKLFFYQPPDGNPLETLSRCARDMGTAVKETNDRSFRLVKSFGPHEFIVFTNREAVCERVVTGTRTEVQRVPVAPAAEPEYEEREVTVEEVSWVCPPSLLGSAG